MAKVTVRNLNYIYGKDSNIGQTIDDLISHISDLKTQNAKLQQQVSDLQKKVK